VPSTGKLALTAAATLAVSMLTITPALAETGGGHRHEGHDLIRADLVGSTPAPVSRTIAGVKPGGAPWVNGPSSARIGENGSVVVSIHGLVIPPAGVNPVRSVVATLVCDGVVATSTSPFALSAAGDGAVSDTIAVPNDCDDPVVLIQPAGNRTVYIASTVDEDD